MEFESFPNGSESDGESEWPLDSDVPPAKDGFTITPKHAGILKGYLKEFQGAKTKAQNRIVETAMGELYALHPEDPFDKKEAKKVSLSTSNYKSITDSLRLAENPKLVLCYDLTNFLTYALLIHATPLWLSSWLTRHPFYYSWRGL